MHMLGYGVNQDIKKAMDYFEKPGMETDARALNAIGYIYYTAPEIFDKDKAKQSLFGGIRKDPVKAFKKFKSAAN